MRETEWKPEELRETAERIRGAMAPKSVTPEMVGGVLTGLVDGLEQVMESQEGVLSPEEREKLAGLPDGEGLGGQIEAAKLHMFEELWDFYCDQYGGYKPAEAPDKKKPFLLNELWFTYEEALRIFVLSKKEYMGTICSNAYKSFQGWTGPPRYVRTVFPLIGTHNEWNIDNAFAFCSSIETVSFLTFANSKVACASAKGAFNSCLKLKKILTPMSFAYAGTLDANTFKGCAELEDMQIAFKTDADLRDCKKLSYESVEYMIANAFNEATEITITVHPDVYAKLTGDTSNAAAAALSAEEIEAWGAVLTAAIEKNIAFVTV